MDLGYRLTAAVIATRCGHLDIVTTLLERGDISLNDVSSHLERWPPCKKPFPRPCPWTDCEPYASYHTRVNPSHTCWWGWDVGVETYGPARTQSGVECEHCVPAKGVDPHIQATPSYTGSSPWFRLLLEADEADLSTWSEITSYEVRK